MRFIVQPGGRLEGYLSVPGDKSISHRAIILSSIAEGDTVIQGFLAGEDNLATIRAFNKLGVSVIRQTDDKILVHGVGKHGLSAPKSTLDLGNSGTAMRLLTGLLAGQSFSSCLIGDESLTKRPMARVVEPLSMMGGKISMSKQGTPPLFIQGNPHLTAINYQMPIASAQVKSALLLAGLYAGGETQITEPLPSRDHTERLLKAFNYPIESQGNHIVIQAKGRLQATDIKIPRDISSAAFFMVGAAITPGSDITLLDVGVNPTRLGIIPILREMGADIKLINYRNYNNEPVADIQVKYSILQGIVIPASYVPLAIDEFPILFIAAAAARGTTLLKGAKELRVKESDRIQTMAQGLLNLGVKVAELDDGIIIEGGHPMTGGVIDTQGDHRVAMAFTMASLIANNSLHINDCSNVATSFPNFIELATQAGVQVDAVFH